MFGHKACSVEAVSALQHKARHYSPAKRSSAVSSRVEDVIAPPFVAPIARARAKAVSRAIPEPSCSTETKQG
jgi:hypothetical protein